MTAPLSAGTTVLCENRRIFRPVAKACSASYRAWVSVCNLAAPFNHATCASLGASIISKRESAACHRGSEFSQSPMMPTTEHISTPTSSPSGPSAPGAIVAVFVVAMSACVIGLLVWKAFDARSVALSRSETDVRNLAHSLAEHASHSLQSADVAMSGMVDLLKYQTPQPARFNAFLKRTADSLPQLSEIGVFDALGNWQYSSTAQTPRFDVSDRGYFAYHRDHADPTMRISAPIVSRLTGKSMIVLSRRIDRPDGSFNGIVLTSIAGDFFDEFYGSFQLGINASITLFRSDGIVLARWPRADIGKDMSDNQLFQSRLKDASSGYYKTTSPFDGVVKYFGYERSRQYQVIGTVGIPEERVLATWRSNLQVDAAVAAVLLCSIILLAALLSSQFRSRMRMENVLREREARYRLLADNIADVVILLDRFGNLIYVSQSVEFVLGQRSQDLVGRSCLEMVHPDDVEAVKHASQQLTDATATRTLVFRTFRGDRSLAWVEINFKLATRAGDRDNVEIVGVLRDVTQRIKMQDELTALNGRLAELATTDGLTGLANRRTLDGFLRHEYELRFALSVLLIDIYHFKAYNDSMGHQAGDECLKRVATVVAEATQNVTGLSARYGGEEFAIILPGMNEAQALTIAESVRLKVRALAIQHTASGRGYLSISIGVASRHAQTLSEASLLGEADQALYEAKRRGRDCCVPASALAHRREDAG
jgi:diguanylate cyclase (GGDEF)-like protein/PAS domain S-box-containing protein